MASTQKINEKPQGSGPSLFQQPEPGLSDYLSYYAGSIFQAPTGYNGDPQFYGYDNIYLVYNQGVLFAELYVYADPQAYDDFIGGNSACSRGGEVSALCPHSGSTCTVVENSDGTCTYKKCLPA